MCDRMVAGSDDRHTLRNEFPIRFPERSGSITDFEPYVVKPWRRVPLRQRLPAYLDKQQLMMRTSGRKERESAFSQYFPESERIAIEIRRTPEVRYVENDVPELMYPHTLRIS